MNLYALVSKFNGATEQPREVFVELEAAVAAVEELIARVEYQFGLEPLTESRAQPKFVAKAWSNSQGDEIHLILIRQPIVDSKTITLLLTSFSGGRCTIAGGSCNEPGVFSAIEAQIADHKAMGRPPLVQDSGYGKSATYDNRDGDRMWTVEVPINYRRISYVHRDGYG